MTPRALAIALAVLAAGCASFDKPVRPTLYDFGPGPAPAAPATVAATVPALVLAEVEVAGAFDGPALVYRLAYADANQLRPYTLARWAAPPAQLVRDRLRERLGRERPVIDQDAATLLERTAGRRLHLLRVQVDEFAHHFTGPAASEGRLRVRATLLELTPAGERLVGQRALAVQRPADSPDAPGGVRALAAATDAAVDDLLAWLRAQP